MRLRSSSNVLPLARQGTLEWRKARAGHATASRFADIMAENSKGDPTKAYYDYVMQLAVERLYGEPIEEPIAASLQWGHDAEPFARHEAEIRSGEIILETGFIKHLTLPWVGVSVDGLIGADGTFEAKCPKNPTVHLKTWASGEMPEEHIPQVQGQLWALNRRRCLFVSYDPRAPKELQLFMKVVYRDDLYIARLEKKVKKFLSDVNVKVKLLKQKAKEAA